MTDLIARLRAAAARLFDGPAWQHDMAQDMAEAADALEQCECGPDGLAGRGA